MKINESKLNKVLDNMTLMSKITTGRESFLLQPKVRKSFVKHICKHGANCTVIVDAMTKDKIKITKRQVSTYLRQIFGTHKKMGRPSLYVQDENERDTESALYK